MIKIISVEIKKEYPAPSPGNQLCNDGAFSLFIAVSPEYKSDRVLLDNFLVNGSTKLFCLYTDPELTEFFNPECDLYVCNESDFFRKEDGAYIYEEWISYNPITRATLTFMKEQVGKTMETHNFVDIVATFNLWWD